MHSFLLSWFLIAQLQAQPAEFYRHVARLVWIVPNVSVARSVWLRAGVPSNAPQYVDLQDARVGGRSAPFSMRIATGSFANVFADWIEPVGEDNLFRDFLTRRKGGVFSLVYRVPDAAALRAEVQRLAPLGVKPLLEGSISTDDGPVDYAFLDTAAEGLYVLGLVATPEPSYASAAPRITQYAFIARNPEAVSAYWEKLGFPPLRYTTPDISERRYRGKPADFSVRLGWQRHASVPFEWIQPLRGPTTYDEHLARHGEGFHHLGLNVSDLDAGVRQWENRGFASSMSGAWGEKDKSGSGRFSYHDLRDCCGVEVELLWSYRQP